MAKGKDKKGSSGGVNSHLRARLTFLHNAANLLQSAATSNKAGDQQAIEDKNNQAISSTDDAPASTEPSATAKQESSFVIDPPKGTGRLAQLSRVYVSHLRGVSLKSQLRLPIQIKRSFCKRCETLLIDTFNCTQEIRNESRGRRKPWADVLVIRCTTCGTEKRFPQTDRRSKKLTERRKEKTQKGKTDNKTLPR